MLNQIPGTELSCYLGPCAWSKLIQFGKELLGSGAMLSQDADPSLRIESEKGTFRVERYALQPRQYPWTYLLVYTMPRPSSPLDTWQQVQFTGRAVHYTKTIAYCDLPEEVGRGDMGYYWQLQLRPSNTMLNAAIAQFRELDEDYFCLVDLQDIDLRNFELYQMILP